MDDPNLAKAEPYYYPEGFAALTKARDEYLKTHH
jgi:hypothetical protein